MLLEARSAEDGIWEGICMKILHQNLLLEKDGFSTWITRTLYSTSPSWVILGSCFLARRAFNPKKHNLLPWEFYNWIQPNLKFIPIRELDSVCLFLQKHELRFENLQCNVIMYCVICQKHDQILGNWDNVYQHQHKNFKKSMNEGSGIWIMCASLKKNMN